MNFDDFNDLKFYEKNTKFQNLTKLATNILKSYFQFFSKQSNYLHTNQILSHK